MSYYCQCCQTHVEEINNNAELYSDEKSPACPHCFSFSLIRCHTRQNWLELFIVQFVIFFVWAIFISIWSNNAPLGIASLCIVWLMGLFVVSRVCQKQPYIET